MNNQKKQTFVTLHSLETTFQLGIPSKCAAIIMLDNVFCVLFYVSSYFAR